MMTIKPFLEKILRSSDQTGRISSDPMTAWRKSLAERKKARIVRIVRRAMHQLAVAKITPVAIPDGVVIPLFNGASLAEDEIMEEKWVALLANAARPDFHPPVSIVFPRILRNLSPREAKFLDGFFDQTKSRFRLNPDPMSAEAIAINSRASEEHLLALGRSTFQFISNEEASLMFDHLVTEGILRFEQNINPKAHLARGRALEEEKADLPSGDVMIHVEKLYRFTCLGVRLMIACRALGE